MKIIFLSTWFPYPLSQGSKIRAYHLLQALARQHEITLVSFVDTKIENEWLAHISSLCHKVELIQRDPFASQSRQTALGRLSLRPTSVVATHSPEMAARVQRLAFDWTPDRIIALTFVTAPYALKIPDVPKVVDVDNLMTQMLYEAYQQTRHPAQKFRRWLAWQKFQRYERWLFGQFDLLLAISAQDRRTLQTLIPAKSGKIVIVPNGVDTVSHRLGLSPATPNTLIFNGALTYSPNYEAINYFLQNIFPLVRAEIPDIRLQITGSTDKVPLTQLPLDDHVIFTGYLPDIRPAVAGSWVCVVPLRSGGGTRLKILEAMALGTPVISTSKGAEGLTAIDGKHLLIADTPGEFAAQTVHLLRNPELRRMLTVNARQLVEEKYNWVEIGQQFCEFAEGVVTCRKKRDILATWPEERNHGNNEGRSLSPG